MPASPQQRQARLDGQIARLRGSHPSANPHPLNTNLSQQWALGWREIDSGMAKKL